MKKVPLLLSLIGLVSVPAFSQVEFGVKAGGQFVNVQEINMPSTPGVFGSGDFEARFSYHAGGFTDISINSHFSLLMELLYTNKGFSFKSITQNNPNIIGGNSSDEVRGQHHFHYISLPVLLNYEVFKNLYVGVGPELGYLYAITVKSPGIKSTSTNPNIFFYKSFEIGMDAGIEYKPIEFLKIGMRYNYGLSSLFEDKHYYDSQGNVLGEFKLQNRVLQLYAGYTFNSRK